MYLALLISTISFFLVATFFLTAFSTAFRRLQKSDFKKTLKTLDKRFFYHHLHHHFFPNREYEGILFALACSQAIMRFCFAMFTVFLMVYFGGLAFNAGELSITFPLGLMSAFGFILIFFMIGEFLPRVLGTRFSLATSRQTAPVVSLLMLPAFPLAYVFFKLTQSFSHTFHFDHTQEPAAQAQQELLEIIEEADISTRLDPHVKKLIESVVLFRDRIAREVMVPRVDIFGLPAEMSIKEAAKYLQKEGYSRTPIYRQSIDNIIGVLMYKDILAKYMEFEQKGDSSTLNASIETILKSALYTPETKKISLLLQEFRKKQVHLAVVVDEYGGTEGIVTIEDILEEIVGDIADEYDQEESLFIALPDGGWIVDARMGILDLEEQLGVCLPQDGDYDTVGGYIFHHTGMIPSKGYVIHQDRFELEILRSNDRCVEKIRIKMISPTANQNKESKNS